MLRLTESSVGSSVVAGIQFCAVMFGLYFITNVASPMEAAARSAGGVSGIRSFGPTGRNHFRSRWNSGVPGYGGYGYGGYVAYGPDSYAMFPQNSGVVESVAVSAEPPRQLTCHRSQQTKIVPSEDGSTKEILITRC